VVEGQKPGLIFLRSWVQGLLPLPPLGIYGPLGYAGNAVKNLPWSDTLATTSNRTDSLEWYFRI
jgi:hypothetical protein